MRKKVFGKKLSRGRGSRTALFRSLIRALVLYGKIKTTRAKAKAVISKIEKIMTKVGKNSLQSRRLVLAELGNDKKITDKLFNELLVLTTKRKSGFVRLINLPRRKGDSAEMASLEWTDNPKQLIKEKKTKKASTTKETKKIVKSKVAKKGKKK